jgi:hypothetical protein
MRLVTLAPAHDAATVSPPMGFTSSSGMLMNTQGVVVGTVRNVQMNDGAGARPSVVLFEPSAQLASTSHHPPEGYDLVVDGRRLRIQVTRQGARANGATYVKAEVVG